MRHRTRTHVLSAASTLVVLALCTWYLLGSVLATGGGGDTVDVTVHLPRTGGLYEGASVSYRGVVIGKVTHLELGPGGVVATARIRADQRIPEDSRVRVRTLSAVGEQYLDFQPRSTGGPVLADGSEVDAQAEDIPQAIGEVAVSLDDLTSQFDTVKVRRVLSELATGLGGADDDLQRLIDASGRVLSTVEDNLDLIRSFLTSSRTVLRIGVDTDGVVRRATSSYAAFARWLRRFDPELFAILSAAPADLDRLRGLVSELSTVLPGYFDAQSSVNDILTSHDPHLRALLQSFPQGLDAFASAMRDSKIYFDLIARRGGVCDYRVEERSPKDVTYRELLTAGRCLSSLRDISQRGAQFAPGATR